MLELASSLLFLMMEVLNRRISSFWIRIIHWELCSNSDLICQTWTQPNFLMRMVMASSMTWNWCRTTRELWSSHFTTKDIYSYWKILKAIKKKPTLKILKLNNLISISKTQMRADYKWSTTSSWNKASKRWFSTSKKSVKKMPYHLISLHACLTSFWNSMLYWISGVLSKSSKMTRQRSSTTNMPERLSSNSCSMIKYRNWFS